VFLFLGSNEDAIKTGQSHNWAWTDKGAFVGAGLQIPCIFAHFCNTDSAQMPEGISLAGILKH